MIFKGPLAGGISQNGYPTDILKSGLQKYIRRGEIQKALYCCWELELFHNLMKNETDEQKRRSLKGFLTNIINRLIIISVEDIGIGCIGIPILIEHVIERYRDDSTRKGALYTLVKYMCEVPRAREISHINTVYYQVLNSDKKDQYILQYPDIYNFDRNITDNMLGFRRLYDKQQDGCFYYFAKQLQENGKNSTMPMISYVIDLETQPNRKKVMCILQQWYKEYSFREFFIFAFQIVLIGLRKQLQIDVGQISSKLKQMDTNEWEESYAFNLKGNRLEMDDYVVDKHTRDGKKMGKGTREFATEGSYVSNESVDLNLQYKEIYISFRQQNNTIIQVEKQDRPCAGITKPNNPCKNKGRYQNGDSWYCSIHNTSKVKVEELLVDIKHKISKETLELMYLGPRGQLMTGKHKKQVFLPKEGKLAGKVVKGPWYTSDIPKLNRMLFRLNEAKKWKIPCIPFMIVSGFDGEMYTLYRNLSSREPSKWILENRQDPYVAYPECISSKYDTVEIIQRESLGIRQLHKCDTKLQDEILFGNQFLFQGIVLMAILGVGDMGPYNILVTEDNQGWIVDYDENTSKTAFTEIGHLYAKSAKCYTDQFLRGIHQNKDRIKQMVEQFDKEYNDIERWQQIKQFL